MSPIAPNQKTFVIFILGLCLGFIFTYVLLNFWQVNVEREDIQMTVPPVSQYLPKDPHSHGEMDGMKGPENEQVWQDLDGEYHHNEDRTKADELYDSVRILCWIMTTPENVDSKAKHVKATWGKRCNRLLFMSSKSDSSLPAIGLNVREGRNYLWGKTRAAFKYIHEQSYDDYDWILKADDDTYVVIENLRSMLSSYNPKHPIYFGHRFKPYIQQGYMSGGAGYVLSQEAAHRFATKALPDGYKCRQDPGGAEDLEMGTCLQRVGVYAADSRDDQGRDRFLPFTPIHHLVPGMIPKDNWFWDFNYYPAKEVHTDSTHWQT